LGDHKAHSLEDDNDDSNLEFFYTPLKSLSQPLFATTKSHMKEYHGRWNSKKLLDFHEIIVVQVLNTRCACSCHLKPTRKSFNKVLYFDLPSSVNDNEGSSQRVRTTWALQFDWHVRVFMLIPTFPLKSSIGCKLFLVDIGCKLIVPTMA
jgi:hypothetical protein